MAEHLHQHQSGAAAFSTDAPGGANAVARLDWLEVGRGLAAFGVVLAHLTRWQGGSLGSPHLLLRSLGPYSVEFFFVLSGFIILYVHRADLGAPTAIPRYLWRRSIRVLPTYWFTLALAIVVNQTVQVASARVALTPGGLATQILLLPGELIISQAWTLRHELLFYGMFLLMIAHLRIGLVAFTFWMALAAGNLLLLNPSLAIAHDGPGIVLHHYNLDFALGMALALAVRRGWNGWALGLASASAMAVELIILAGQTAAFWPVVRDKLIFAAIVALAVLASSRRVPAPRALVALGAMSYALYISHELFGIAVGGVLRRLALDLPAILVIALRIAAALVGAALLHRLFERPMLKRLGRLGPAAPLPIAIHGHRAMGTGAA